MQVIFDAIDAWFGFIQQQPLIVNLTLTAGTVAGLVIALVGVAWIVGKPIGWVSRELHTRRALKIQARVQEELAAMLKEDARRKQLNNVVAWRGDGPWAA